MNGDEVEFLVWAAAVLASLATLVAMAEGYMWRRKQSSEAARLYRPLSRASGTSLRERATGRTYGPEADLVTDTRAQLALCHRWPSPQNLARLAALEERLERAKAVGRAEVAAATAPAP